jgi:hypothetical protein
MTAGWLKIIMRMPCANEERKKRKANVKHRLLEVGEYFVKQVQVGNRGRGKGGRVKKRNKDRKRGAK